MTTPTPQLPADIGGFQHLEPDVICQAGDIYVLSGKPTGFVNDFIGDKVAFAEQFMGERVYRRIPCPSHGNDKPAPSPLPVDPAARKGVPIYSGFLRYFPLAVSYVAQVSKRGNDQHNPGQPLHWDRSKSGDELDAGSRHLLEAGGFDTDGARHSGKHAWRAMANLQKELEAAAAAGEPWFMPNKDGAQ